ncbi:Transferase [Macleaya cordata]|uniref:Transferase n=1 Tax=Macleaya cordata TaxID=56857 RepID=A0A200QRW1_MACCD|nr:Transferase [Macleaya cordata]
MGYETESKIKRKEIVTKKFVFKAPKIAELKQRSIIGCSSTTNNNNCRSDHTDDVQEYRTRVEAVSAFIWKRFIDVDQAKEGAVASAARVYVGSHAVNMRTRIVPPLPTNSIGNMYCAAIALSIINGNPENDQDKEDHQYSNLVGKVRDAIRKIDSDHVRELQTTDALLNSMKPIEEGVSSGQTQLLTFSSWCRFPIYEADFGWGKPIWVSTATLPFKNVVVFMDTRTGDGIEAWVNMNKEDMSELERDDELHAFVS